MLAFVSFSVSPAALLRFYFIISGVFPHLCDGVFEIRITSGGHGGPPACLLTVTSHSALGVSGGLPLDPRCLGHSGAYSDVILASSWSWALEEGSWGRKSRLPFDLGRHGGGDGASSASWRQEGTGCSLDLSLGEGDPRRHCVTSAGRALGRQEWEGKEVVLRARVGGAEEQGLQEPGYGVWPLWGPYIEADASSHGQRTCLCGVPVLAVSAWPGTAGLGTGPGPSRLPVCGSAARQGGPPWGVHGYSPLCSSPGTRCPRQARRGTWGPRRLCSPRRHDAGFCLWQIKRPSSLQPAPRRAPRASQALLAVSTAGAGRGPSGFVPGSGKPAE
nr:uncharacterized protein LOC127488523 [Oryctolagus cuniculus]